MLKIVEVIEYHLEKNITILAKCVVPLVTVSVLANFFDDLIPRFKRYRVKLEGLRDSLKDLAINMMKENTDALSLERSYTKQVLPCRYNLV